MQEQWSSQNANNGAKDITPNTTDQHCSRKQKLKTCAQEMTIDIVEKSKKQKHTP
jgi:hypothetical protein